MSLATVLVRFKNDDPDKIVRLSRVPCLLEHVRIGERVFHVEGVELLESKVGKPDAEIWVDERT